MKTLAIHNVKGGVGKTSAALNLAYFASRRGARTLLWDLDPQGAASFYLAGKTQGNGEGGNGGGRNLLSPSSSLEGLIAGTDYEHLDLLTASFSLRRTDLVLGSAQDPERRFSELQDSVQARYDYLILDCAPGISLVTESVFKSADAVLVPVIPTTLSVLTLEQVLDFIRHQAMIEVAVMPFFSMVDWRKTLHRDLVLKLRAEKPDFLATVVPNATEAERMGVHMAPVGKFAAKSRPALAFAELWREVEERLLPKAVPQPIAAPLAAISA